MKKILVCFGTRPEAIKMCPLVIALRKKQCFDVKIVVSGQHKEMLQSVLKVFHMVPDYNLDIMKENQTLFDITNSTLEKSKVVFEKENPDLVLVHGDTSTSFAFSLAAFYLGIKVGHVEAGLRTYDIHSPFPEEFNRCAISVVSELDFAPTDSAKCNLLRMGKNEKFIFVTGNTGIDSLRYTIDENYFDENIKFAKDNPTILVTCHRRENIGANMENIFSALKRIALEFKTINIIYPVHKNPKVREIARKHLDNVKNIKLVEPLNTIEFHNLMNCCKFVVTDSGGIQEEAPFLGKPVLVVRDTTERPEAVKAGTCKLSGVNEDSIYNDIKELITSNSFYNKMANSINPYGDGFASEKIADILEQIYDS